MQRGEGCSVTWLVRLKRGDAGGGAAALAPHVAEGRGGPHAGSEFRACFSRDNERCLNAPTGQPLAAAASNSETAAGQDAWQQLKRESVSRPCARRALAMPWPCPTPPGGSVHPFRWRRAAGGQLQHAHDCGQTSQGGRQARTAMSAALAWCRPARALADCCLTGSHRARQAATGHSASPAAWPARHTHAQAITLCMLCTGPARPACHPLTGRVAHHASRLPSKRRQLVRRRGPDLAIAEEAGHGGAGERALGAGRSGAGQRVSD